MVQMIKIPERLRREIDDYVPLEYESFDLVGNSLPSVDDPKPQQERKPVRPKINIDNLDWGRPL